MPSVSPKRGRTRSRQQTSAFAKSPTPSKSRSAPRRTISPRSGSRSRTPSRTPPACGDQRNGVKGGRDRSRSPTRTVSRSRSGGRGGRSHRDRSYTRSLSRSSPIPKSSKVVQLSVAKLGELLMLHRSWWRSLRRTSVRVIYERYSVPTAPFASLTCQ